MGTPPEHPRSPRGARAEPCCSPVSPGPWGHGVRLCITFPLPTDALPLPFPTTLIVILGGGSHKRIYRDCCSTAFPPLPPIPPSLRLNTNPTELGNGGVSHSRGLPTHKIFARVFFLCLFFFFFREWPHASPPPPLRSSLVCLSLLQCFSHHPTLFWGGVSISVGGGPHSRIGDRGEEEL